MCNLSSGDAGVPMARALAWTLLLDGGARIHMKDVLFVVVTVAFFALGWVYARSFDRL